MILRILHGVFRIWERARDGTDLAASFYGDVNVVSKCHAEQQRAKLDISDFVFRADEFALFRASLLQFDSFHDALAQHFAGGLRLCSRY